MWMAMMLKDRYNSKNEKGEIFSMLVNKYGKSQSDIFMVSGDSNIGLSYYVFIRDDDLDSLFSRLLGEKYFCNMAECLKVSDDEVIDMSRGIDNVGRDAKFGDIVRIRRGDYRGLNGIVLRKSRRGMIEVGFKFCFGSVCCEFGDSDFEVVGNIFNHVKINR